MSWAMLAFPGIASAKVASSSQNQGGNERNSNTTTKAPKERQPDPELSAAIQKLYDLDKPNRLVPGKDYAIDIQGNFKKAKNKSNDDGSISSVGGEDAAPDPLFVFVDPAVFRDRPTYRSFLALLDNYQANVCSPEEDTSIKQEEARVFLRDCMATPVMQFCYKYCQSRLAAEAAAADVADSTAKNTNSKANINSFETEEDFIRLLYKIWFKMYSRSRECGEDHNKNNGSSGFEHVFVGEVRSGKVIGFHNWIQIYMQEKLGNVNYRGSISRGRKMNNNNATRVLTYNLQWNGVEKYLGTSFIGVSPEFELALYTMVFLVGKTDNIVQLNLGVNDPTTLEEQIVDLDLKCFKTKGKIGSSFVESLS